MSDLSEALFGFIPEGTRGVLVVSLADHLMKRQDLDGLHTLLRDVLQEAKINMPVLVMSSDVKLSTLTDEGLRKIGLQRIFPVKCATEVAVREGVDIANYWCGDTPVADEVRATTDWLKGT